MSDLYKQSYGQRGCVVRVYEPRPGANFMIAPRINGKYHAESLGHRDPERAKAEAYALIAAVMNGSSENTTKPDKLTLEALVAMYLESEQHKDLGDRQRPEKEALLRRIVGYFGPLKRVSGLDDDAVRGLLRARREGTHGFRKGKKQSEYHCYAALRSVIMWGLEKRSAKGNRILRENPLAGTAKRLKIRPNRWPNQPMLAAGEDFAESAAQNVARWPSSRPLFGLLPGD